MDADSDMDEIEHEIDLEVQKLLEEGDRIAEKLEKRYNKLEEFTQEDLDFVLK